jgi:hypothetical protein
MFSATILKEPSDPPHRESRETAVAGPVNISNLHLAFQVEDAGVPSSSMRLRAIRQMISPPRREAWKARNTVFAESFGIFPTPL